MSDNSISISASIDLDDIVSEVAFDDMIDAYDCSIETHLAYLEKHLGDEVVEYIVETPKWKRYLLELAKSCPEDFDFLIQSPPLIERRKQLDEVTQREMQHEVGAGHTLSETDDGIYYKITVVNSDPQVLCITINGSTRGVICERRHEREAVLLSLDAKGYEFPSVDDAKLFVKAKVEQMAHAANSVNTRGVTA